MKIRQLLLYWLAYSGLLLTPSREGYGAGAILFSRSSLEQEQQGNSRLIFKPLNLSYYGRVIEHSALNRKPSPPQRITLAPGKPIINHDENRSMLFDRTLLNITRLSI